MTFSTNLFAKLNNCSLLRSFCQGFTSTMWFNMNSFSPMMMNSASLFSLGWMNCCSPMMNSTSLFSLGSMNYSPPQTPYTDTLPTLYTDSLANCYQGGMYNFNNSTSLFANNNVNYFNGCWGGALPQVSMWNVMPQITNNGTPTSKANKSKKIVGHRNIAHDCCKNPPAGTIKKTLPNGQEVLAFSNCNTEQCNEDWADLQEYLMQAADDMGLTLVYVSLARTNAEQQTLYNQNPTYTAKPGTSAHNYGIASDIALYDKNGHKIDPHSETMAEFARKVKKLSSDIEWGGDWANIGDGERHHFNIKNRKKYQTEDNLVK